MNKLLLNFSNHCYITAYDFVAGSKHNIGSSYLLSRERALELFPMLRKEKLCGAIVYYDGSHNDARMNISIVLTAARMGATIANHLRVVLNPNSSNNPYSLKLLNDRIPNLLNKNIYSWD